MLVCMDTEFSDLIGIVVDIKLISAGFVAEDGQEFYFELIDHYAEGECSSFVLEAVLPHLDAARHGMTAPEAAQRLKAWIEALGEHVEMVTDAPGYDWWLIAELLRDHDCFPKNLNRIPKHFDVNSVQLEIENYFTHQPMAVRHHALWDARALDFAMKHRKS